jgi:cell division protein FtsZ
MGISDLITTPGTYGNIDFADIKTILSNSGTALMGVGTASGERRATEAATKAINSPLLDISISGAKGVLFSIAGSEDLSMWEMQEAAKIIIESVDKDAKIISGTTIDDSLPAGEIKVTVIATGFPTPHRYSNNFSKETFGVIKNITHESQQSQTQQPSNIRNFFGNTTFSNPKNSSDYNPKIVKEETPITESHKLEEVGEEEESVLSQANTKKAAKLFEKKQEAKKEVEVVAEIDDSDDWSSSIPSILRRNR